MLRFGLRFGCGLRLEYSAEIALRSWGCGSDGTGLGESYSSGSTRVRFTVRVWVRVWVWVWARVSVRLQLG